VFLLLGNKPKHQLTLQALVTEGFFFGGLYSVTALRENDHERVTVYTKHRLILQALVTEALGS
jgi:hypothetical protein